MRFFRVVSFVLVLAPGVLSGVAGCDHRSQPGDNQGCEMGTCVYDVECPAGFVCLRSCCRRSPDGGVPDAESPTPDIRVEPWELIFGCGWFGTEVTEQLTVRNAGAADLEITAITINEVGQLQEFHADPEGLFSPLIVLSPAASLTIEVLLRSEDDELDLGELWIDSNDPDEPRLHVPLILLKCCCAEIEVCALDMGVVDPEPFVDCTVDPLTSEPWVDFGLLAYGQDASRIVAIHNIADGHALLMVDDIAVTSATGLADHCLLELFWLEEDPSTGEATEMEALLPAVLSSGDPGNGVPEDRLFVRLWFDAALSGPIPAAELWIHSSALEADTYVPIVGIVQE